MGKKLSPSTSEGASTFTKHETTFASLEKYVVTGLEGIISGLNEVNCYPNPFSEKVKIEFYLAKESEVSVEVINQMGQCVKFLLTHQTLSNGLHKIIWSGRNSLNQKVSSGIYNLKVNINDTYFHRKIVFNALQ